MTWKFLKHLNLNISKLQVEGNVPPKQTRRIRLRTLQSECFDTACLPFRRPALLTWQPFWEHQGLEGRSRFRSRATLKPASAQSLAEMRDFQELRHFSAQKGDYRRRWNHGKKLHILTPWFWARHCDWRDLRRSQQCGPMLMTLRFSGPVLCAGVAATTQTMWSGPGNHVPWASYIVIWGIKAVNGLRWVRTIAPCEQRHVSARGGRGSILWKKVNWIIQMVVMRLD